MPRNTVRLIALIGSLWAGLQLSSSAAQAQPEMKREQRSARILHVSCYDSPANQVLRWPGVVAIAVLGPEDEDGAETLGVAGDRKSMSPQQNQAAQELCSELAKLERTTATLLLTSIGRHQFVVGYVDRGREILLQDFVK